MENIVQLQEQLTSVFQSCNVNLYEMKWLNHSEHILQISIMYKDGTMDLDTCAMVSEKISNYLDEHELIQSSYMLEVCSPGAEREIKDMEELKTIKEPYVYLRLRRPIKSKYEISGSVISYENNIILLEYRDKSLNRKLEIEKENVEYIRLAVKF